MAKGDISPKITLEGEREFARQMKDAADSVKTLDSELKLAQAEFENTGDAQQYASDKARILKEQMQAQQRAVDAAQKAVDQLKAKGVDPTSKAMQTWNTRLNTAKTRLLNMQTQLNATEGELVDQGKAVDDTAGKYDQLLGTADSVNRKITLDQAISAVDALQAKVEGVIKAGARAVKALYGWETEAGKWADDLATAATQAGVDVETYQSWAYASLFIDTEVDKIISARSKLTAKLGSLSDEDAKAFNEISVATRNADGSVRDATDVLFDVVDALGRYEDATEREIHAQKIFGDGWKDLQPLIKAGSQAYKDLAKEGMENAVVSEQQVAALGEWNDAQNKLTATADKTKYTLLSSLAPAFKDAADAMSTALSAFNSFLETDEGRAALQSLGDAFGGVVSQLTDIDAKKLIDDAAGAVNTLNTALQWISENGETVRNVLIGLGASWAGLKLTGDVLRFVQGVEAFKGLTGAGKGAASDAASAASGTGAAALSRPAGLLAKAEAAGLVAVGVEAAAQMVNEVRSQGTFLGLGQRDENGDIDIGGLKFGGSMEGTTSLWDAIRYSLGGGQSGAGHSFDVPAADAGARDAMGVPIAELEAAQAAYQETGEAAQQMAESVSAGTDAATEAVEEMNQSVTDAAEEEMSWFDVIGSNAGQGLANGITEKIPAAVAAAQAMADAVTSTLQSALQIASPSKVMARLGGYVTQGFAQGISGQLDAVDDAVYRMSRAAVARPARMAAEAPQRAAGGADTVHVTMVLDGKTVGETFGPLVDGYIGAQMANTRL